MIGRGKVTADSLNLRKVPHDGEIIKELAKGTAFDVVDVKVTATTEWLLVCVDRMGCIGYLAAKFCEWQRNIPTRPQPRPVNPHIPPDVMPRPPIWPKPTPHVPPPLFADGAWFALAAGVVFTVIVLFWMVAR